MAEPVEVKQRYSSSFVLDQAKLSRMLSILEDNFTDLHPQFDTRYEITLSSGKNIYLNDIEEVLKLDNAVKNPATSLTLRVGGSSETEAESKLPSCIISYDDNRKRNISLTVTSNDAKWANQLFAEIEEQIERTFENNWINKLKQTGEITSAIALFSLGFVVVLTTSYFSQPSRNLTLEVSEANQLIQQAEQSSTVEEKIDFLFELQKREIEKQASNDNPFIQSEFRDFFTIPNSILMLILLLLIGSIFYLYKYCYPHAVFLWGDCLEHYRAILDRRNLVWRSVWLTLILGIIASLVATSAYQIIGSG